MNGSRKSVVLVAVSAVALGLLSSAPAAGAKKKAKPVVVGTDIEGDWGSNQAEELGPGGGPLGSDLLKATISKADAKTLNFVIEVTELPSNGGVPEFVRYVWTMTVGKDLVQLDGKWTNYTRGACDPTAGTCPPPRDPGQGPFMVRGNCTSNEGTAVTCEEIGMVNATFDQAAGTITIPVSMELLKAKPGTKIKNGIQEGSAFQGVWAIPSAFVSQASMPKDELIITKTYKVPR